MARASRPGRRRGKARPSTPGPLRLRFLPRAHPEPGSGLPPGGSLQPPKVALGFRLTVFTEKQKQILDRLG